MSFAMVLLPAPDGPSMAITFFKLKSA
jgi:hypothetical protein